MKPTATANIQIQRGAIYCGLNQIKQLLVLAKTVTGLKTAYFIYGYLPVELASFNTSVNNSNVSLYWITSSETNNSGFDIERKSADSKQ
ncbi:MAG: hypothetical protein IAE98_11790 [Candidatus Kapabacteria bacterium]|nr:hypothetical protein [Candidatus Kapabacteria bacterium]